MRVRSSLGIVAALLVVTPAAIAAEPHHHGPADPSRLGSVQFENSCAPAAQETFSRAMAMLHSFWYDEAARQFRTVAEQDPRCAMAWWGVAMTQWQPLWEPRGPNPESMQRGVEAIRKAVQLGGTDRERAYVAALQRFYTNTDTADHATRIVAYEQAMDDLRKRYPEDPEATTFYSLSLLSSAASLERDPTHARQKRAGELLEPILKAHPDHPGVAHYIIHAYDYADLAPRALEAARRYASIAPDSPHALHMPSHIFTRLGLWEESIASNRSVIQAARRHGVPGEELHGVDYLVFAHLQRGEDGAARRVMEEMPPLKDVGATHLRAGVYSHAAVPARYAIERRQWTEAARLPEPSQFPGGRYAWADAMVYFARALGAARTGNVDQARSDIAKLGHLQQTLTEHGETYWARQVEIQHRAATAWLTLAEQRPEQALQIMRAAADLEDQTDKQPVTPGQIVPARDLLGQMLLEQGRPDEALAAFARVLEMEPNRFPAVYGAARAAELAGDMQTARARYAQLLQIAPNGEREELRRAREFLGRSSG